jgi:asparagine synthetase B (glutamine-hydrolysing)
LSSKEIDLEAFVDLIKYAYILGDTTLFKGLKTLPPGSILIFENGQLNIQSYFYLQKLNPMVNMISRIRKSFARFLKSRCGVASDPKLQRLRM